MDEEGAVVAPCCLCGQTEDDQLKFGQLFRVDGLTVHHFCMVRTTENTSKSLSLDIVYYTDMLVLLVFYAQLVRFLAFCRLFEIADSN